MSPAAPATSSPWPRVVAWAAVIGSTLPDIIWQESGLKISFWFTTIESACILVAALAAIWVPSLRGIWRFLVALAILNFAWEYIAPNLANLPAVRHVTDNASWGARLYQARFSSASLLLEAESPGAICSYAKEIPRPPRNRSSFSDFGTRCRGRGLDRRSFWSSPWLWRPISI
jgi:hypothetical protein